MFSIYQISKLNISRTRLLIVSNCWCISSTLQAIGYVQVNTTFTWANKYFLVGM